MPQDLNRPPGDQATVASTGAAYRGSTLKWGHRVITDPADAQKIYITTFGGGVWHGSVNGEDRPVDITTPELQPGR
jgi:hypothetical protein